MSLELSLPASVDFSKSLPHIPENVKTSLMTVLPTNGGGKFKAGSVIQFDLPARAGLYLDGKTAFLRYRMQIVSHASNAASMRANCAVVPFFKLDEYVNSSTVNSVYNYHQTANMYINTHLGVSEKYAVQSALFSAAKAGVDTLNGQDSVVVPAGKALTDNAMSFSTPLYCSALSGADKLIPTGLMGPWRIQLTLAQLTDLTNDTTNFSDYQIDNVELCINAIDMGIAVDQMVASTGDKLILKTTCWANQSQSVASGTSGVVSIPFNHRYQSVNNIYLLASGTNVAKDLNGPFDSRDITGANGGSYQFTIGSDTYPQLPINTTLNKPAVIQYLRECTSSQYDWRYAMSINATEFAYTASTGATTLVEPAKFYVGIPLSKLQSSNPYAPTSLLSGVSCASTPIIANINIGSQTDQAENVSMIAEYDALIHIDVASRQVSVVA